MELNKRLKLLGMYDLIVAVISVYTGYCMARAQEGVFAVYPKEWSGKLPFQNWMVPGIIFILLFGLGNMIASLACFLHETGWYWILSPIMGMFLVVSFLVQMITLGECYLATLQFLLLGSFQIILSLYVYKGIRISDKRMKA